MSTDEPGGAADEERVLAAEFVLGLLDPAEHEALAARIAADPGLGPEVAMWRRRFAGLDAGFPATPPPADALEKIEARLFPPAVAAPRHAGLWESLGFWRGLAAACLVIAGLALGYATLAPRPALTGQELVAALEAEGSNVKFVAFYDAASGTVRLAALAGAAVPDRDFELWAIKGDAAPVSMGVIPVNAKSDIRLTNQMKQGFGAGTVLAVTLEPKGGSPTGAPTGAIVAKGVATAI